MPARSAPPYEVSWSGLTHPGRFRPNNEDAFLAVAIDGHEVRYLGKTGQASLAENDFLFAVSDGLGGARSGEFASRIAVDKITQLLPPRFRAAAMGLRTGFADVLGALYDDIHHELAKLGQSYEECQGMGATLSLGWLTPSWLYFAHIGDSRIYYLPKQGGIKQVSHDHNHVGWLHRQGKLNEREVRTHPHRHALDQALGAGNQYIDPQVGAIGCEPGDRFVFCSDGLTGGLWDRTMDELIRTPPGNLAHLPVAERLVQEAVASCGRDNTTAVVIEIRHAVPAPK